MNKQLTYDMSHGKYQNNYIKEKNFKRITYDLLNSDTLIISSFYQFTQKQ